MSLPDFTPRLMELQALNTKLAHEKGQLVQALEDLIDAYRSGDDCFAPCHNAEDILKKVTK